ncbi:iron ABC transporter substrate-binding protein [Amycolatopsis antarctica]|uniref:Iron ABC transporter substrate-binding protein n=1 Tax=Amycolatopsis antarctica TaxID=1854586 RepID=A0A263D1J6_9PSEU|nr:iron-siderophore ABC transporter substrate-binding protein [Amycolatopsis antarctica]OZM72069.1 iron ABC transporter substrate-binding protein [Amycolatopsis antarctica]
MHTSGAPTTQRRHGGGRRAARLLAAALACTLLAACGGSGGEQQPEASGSGGTLPVTITHKYGSTEVTKADRVVTLGLSDHEVALALGVKPIGAVDWFKERPFGVYPWQQEKWNGTQPEIVGERDDFDIEKIIELQPDVVIAQYSGMTKEQYDKLSEFFPVVAQPTGFADYAAPWRDMTRAIGTAMGKATEAEGLIKGVEDKFAAARQQHPEFAEQTMVVADSFEPGVYSAFAGHDPKLQFMLDLGFQAPQQLMDLPKEKNATEVGSEGLPLMDVDRLVWLASDTAMQQRVEADPLYAKLKVVTENRDLFIPYSDPPLGAAVSFGTVLSMPYAIDQLVPMLAGQA